jgi:hypothetical protein
MASVPKGNCGCGVQEGRMSGTAVVEGTFPLRALPVGAPLSD